MDFDESEFEAILKNWNGFVKFPIKETLKKMKYKVCLENLFSSDAYKKLSKLEKSRIKNINNNLSIMLLLGMPLPSENALRVKVGLTPHRKLVFTNPFENNNKDDETWRPYKQKVAKPHLMSAHEYEKRQKFIILKCMSNADGSKTDVQSCKNELSTLVGSWPSDVLKALEYNEITPKKEKDVKRPKQKSDILEPCSTRGIKLNFTEPVVPEDDHYLYCDACSKVYDGECPTHGPYLSVQDTKIKLGLTDRARRTCPNGVSISPSKIRSSGLGAWADKDFPVNSVFGPYEGVDVHKDDLQKLKLTFDGGYAWEIYKNGNLSHYVDGSDQKKSNWLRFVNCARTEDEQNLVAYQYKGKIYYRSFKEIKRGMELLVWYGEQYAEQLGILVKRLHEDNKNSRQKASSDYLECEKCGQLLTDEEALQKHLKSKHPDRSVVKRFKCEFCSYSSDYSTCFNNHIRTHTKEKPFECSYCSKRFSQKVTLNGHISIIHTNNRPFECNKCDKKFVNLSYMKHHIRVVHDKYRSYVCDVCDLKFISASELKAHKLIHSGVRDHKCQYCGKRFTQLVNLQKHERIHTGEKPYKCKECFVAFNQISHLRRHVILHHTRNFPHKCSVCDKGFLSPGLLKKHSIRCQG